jgi:hypothetical protein
MTAEENIEQKLEKLAQSIAPNERIVEKVMSRINSKTTASPYAIATQNIWRIIMKSPITKIAAAAVIIIACSTGLILWKSTGSGIALADVLTRIEQVTGYTYQMNSTMTRQQTTSKWTSTILVSTENGIKMTVTKTDLNSVQSQPRRYRHAVGDEAYLLPKLSSLIFIKHKEKIYDRYKYDGQKLEYYKEEYNEPRIIIKQILSCEHTSLGQSVIDEITVKGFQTTDIAYEGGFFGQAELEGEVEKVDVKLWVDVNTFLPVRLEEDIVTKKGTYMHEVSYDFRWNVIVNPDDFEPNIPEDYRSPAGDIIIPAFGEENAIKGLKLFADAVGKYPASFEDGALVGEWRKHTGFDPNSYKDLSDEERTRKTSEVISLAVPGFLYKTLVEENKDPVYYGETVRPGDADKVLLRWKIDDDQYRVIFGDLHADTATADVMKELEMAQPK